MIIVAPIICIVRMIFKNKTGTIAMIVILAMVILHVVIVIIVVIMLIKQC